MNNRLNVNFTCCIYQLIVNWLGFVYWHITFFLLSGPLYRLFPSSVGSWRLKLSLPSNLVLVYQSGMSLLCACKPDFCYKKLINSENTIDWKFIPSTVPLISSNNQIQFFVSLCNYFRGKKITVLFWPYSE